jgi:hypothetical protein
MIKARTIPVIFLALLFLIPLCNIKASEEDEYRINAEFNLHKFNIGRNTFILDYKCEDVNGDNMNDKVILIGHKPFGENDLLSDKVNIIIEDGKSKKFFKLSLGELDRGFNGRIFLGDFTGDNVSDIFVSICNNESDGCPNYSLISFVNNKNKPVFNQKKFSTGLTFKIDFVDNFKVNIFNKELSKFYGLDLNGRKEEYIKHGHYNNEGELLKEVKGDSNFFEDLRPVDQDKDGNFELIGIQRLSGIQSENTIGYAKSLWKFDGKKMSLISLEIIPNAKPGSLQKVQRIVPVWNITN